jgi:hypothetical protein
VFLLHELVFLLLQGLRRLRNCQTQATSERAIISASVQTTTGSGTSILASHPPS